MPHRSKTHLLRHFRGNRLNDQALRASLCAFTGTAIVRALGPDLVRRNNRSCKVVRTGHRKKALMP
jgi:hypothetical protein